MAKKKYKQGATRDEIDAQFAVIDVFGDNSAFDAIPAPESARPAKPQKAVRLDWDPVERISTDEAWDAFLRHA